MRNADPKRDVLVILAWAALVAVPTALSQMTLRGMPGEIPFADNPSPYGYTVSLLFFVLPVLALGYWHVRHPRHRVDRKAFFVAAAIMAAVGFVLDFFFAFTFFEFLNPEATLGVHLPAWAFCLPGTDPCRMGIVPSYIPVEDAVFYVFGGLYMVSVYVWADRERLQAYEPEHYRVSAKEVTRLVRPSTKSAVVCLALVALGFVLKRTFDSDFPDKLPAYYLFLLLGSFLPTFFLYRVVKDFVNWRAFASAFTVLVFTSLIWEATLGLPYGWWDYKHEYMLGIDFPAWYDLPVEAVLLWLLGAWNAILVFELLRVFFHMERKPTAALFGRGGGGD